MTAKRFVLDGELIIQPASAFVRGAADCASIRPKAGSQAAAETPADVHAVRLARARRQDRWPTAPVRAPRQALEALVARSSEPTLLLSPATHDRDEALGWLERSGGALDGVIAKRLDQPYRPGERAMVKVKQRRTADCVVGGFRYAARRQEVGSLLLGLYDDQGLRNHVGFTLMGS